MYSATPHNNAPGKGKCYLHQNYYFCCYSKGMAACTCTCNISPLRMQMHVPSRNCTRPQQCAFAFHNKGMQRLHNNSMRLCFTTKACACVSQQRHAKAAQQRHAKAAQQRLHNKGMHNKGMHNKGMRLRSTTKACKGCTTKACKGCTTKACACVSQQRLAVAAQGPILEAMLHTCRSI